ncbi:MAG: sulfatase-like hydrolase/transferase, partial [Pseudomonadota bacterium]
NAALTPNLDALAMRGLRFTDFWGQPVCTPSRSEMLTGRFGFRTGVLSALGGPRTDGDTPAAPKVPEGSPRESGSDVGLVDMIEVFLNSPNLGPSLDEFTLPMALRAHPETPYATAAIGKWHLADTENGWTEHPNLFGFDHSEGPFGGVPESYFAWNKLTNGDWSVETGYMPTQKVNDALAWIGSQEDDPWFMWLAFNTPHSPFHKPPTDLINTPELRDLDPQADPADNPGPYYRAMVEALDTEIGRLLSGIDADVLANTVVMFIGDNGTDKHVIGAPYSEDRAKGTVYQGGVHIPVFVAGPGIPAGTTSNAIAKTADLFATVIDLSGMTVADVVPAGTVVDGISLLPIIQDPATASVRDWNYVDVVDYTIFTNNERRAIRDERFKLVQIGRREEFYDLRMDPNEQSNLLDLREMPAEASQAYELLAQELEDLLAS